MTNGTGPRRRRRSDPSSDADGDDWLASLRASGDEPDDFSGPRGLAEPRGRRAAPVSPAAPPPRSYDAVPAAPRSLADLDQPSGRVPRMGGPAAGRPPAAAPVVSAPARAGRREEPLPDEQPIFQHIDPVRPGDQAEAPTEEPILKYMTQRSPAPERTRGGRRRAPEPEEPQPGAGFGRATRGDRLPGGYRPATGAGHVDEAPTGRRSRSAAFEPPPSFDETPGFDPGVAFGSTDTSPRRRRRRAEDDDEMTGGFRAPAPVEPPARRRRYADDEPGYGDFGYDEPPVRAAAPPPPAPRVAPRRPGPAPMPPDPMPVRPRRPEDSGPLPRMTSTASGGMRPVPGARMTTTTSGRMRAVPADRMTGTSSGSMRPVRVDPVKPKAQPHKRWTTALAILGVIVLLAVCGTGTYFMVQDEQNGAKQARSGNSQAPQKRDISSKTVDPAPLTEAEVFGKPQVPGATPGEVYPVLKTQLSTDCAVAATQDLGGLLVQAGCDQVVRATLKSPDNTYLITAGVFNLADEPGAREAHEKIEPTINAQKGRFTGLLAGPETEVFIRAPMILGWHARGHFLAYCIIARADGKPFDQGDQFPAKIQKDILATYLLETVIGARAVVQPGGVASAPASPAPSSS